MVQNESKNVFIVGKMHPVGKAGSREVAVWQGAPGSIMVATSYIYNQSGTLLREI